jgi:hypothetical protein
MKRIKHHAPKRVHKKYKEKRITIGTAKRFGKKTPPISLLRSLATTFITFPELILFN